MLKKTSKIVNITIFVFILTIIFAILGTFQIRDLKKIFDYNFFNLLILVILVQAITHTFKMSHYDRKVLELISSISGDIRYSMIIPPIFFGLLPMPAGAMLTADLSRTAGENLKTPKKWVFFFNYWFRHVCEFSWPLYSALILAAGISNIPIKKFVSGMLLYFIIALVIGIILLLLKVKPNNNERIKIPAGELFRNLISTLWPVVLIILLMLLKIDLKYCLAIVLILLFITEKSNFSNILKTLKLSIISEISLIVFMVLIFKGVVENSNTLNMFADFLTTHNVPQIIPVIILPMAMAFLTGLTSAGIGSTGPILQGLFVANPYFPYLAYVSAIAGVLISPFHLCLVTTKEYFKASFRDVYSTILLPTLVVLLVSIFRSLLV